VAGARGGYPTVGPTLHLHLPYKRTYPTRGPTLQEDLPYKRTYPTVGPTLQEDLPYKRTYPTLAPTLHLHLPYTCAPAHPGSGRGKVTKPGSAAHPAGYPTPQHLPYTSWRATLHLHAYLYANPALGTSPGQFPALSLHAEGR
jgi:hypothetical protein